MKSNIFSLTVVFLFLTTTSAFSSGRDDQDENEQLDYYGAGYEEAVDELTTSLDKAGMLHSLNGAIVIDWPIADAIKDDEACSSALRMVSYASRNHLNRKVRLRLARQAVAACE